MRTVEAARRREAAATGGDSDEPHGRHAPRGAAPRPELPTREHHLVPAVAAAVLPYAQQARPASRAQGGFDFFGVSKQAAIDPAPATPALTSRHEVIDLTAHDETEQLDVRELRAHS